MINILLQTTIVPDADDWSIERFDLLRQLLSGSLGSHGRPLFNVTARNRGPVERPDPVLSTLHARSGICLSTSGVRTNPGQITLARTPWGAPSLATTFARPQK